MLHIVHNKDNYTFITAMHTENCDTRVYIKLIKDIYLCD